MIPSDKLHTSQIQADSHQRTHRLACMLTEEEMTAIIKYIERYGISNKSNWMRRTLLHEILSHCDENYPTLFNEHEMRR